jgi:hypothetical protein
MSSSFVLKMLSSELLLRMPENKRGEPVLIENETSTRDRMNLSVSHQNPGGTDVVRTVRPSVSYE